jgi:hypothetical protein
VITSGLSCRRNIEFEILKDGLVVQRWNVLLESQNHFFEGGILMLGIHSSYQFNVASALVGEGRIYTSRVLGQTGKKVTEVKNSELLALE